MSCTNTKSLNPFLWNWKLNDDKTLLYGTEKKGGKKLTATQNVNRGGAGGFGTVYIYEGQLDGKSVDVAVKSFFAGLDDDEFIVLKFIKDVNICAKCPSVVCLDSFDDRVALESLSHHLTFKDILQVNKSKQPGDIVDVTNLNFDKKLKEYISNFINGTLCLRDENLIYFDFNPKNIMIKECENNNTTEAILVDIGAASVYKNGKFGTTTVPTSYPPISIKLNSRGDVVSQSVEGSDWSGSVEPSKIKGLKSLLTFITMLLYLSLNVYFQKIGEYKYAFFENAAKNLGTNDLNNIMAYEMPFRFKSSKDEYYDDRNKTSTVHIFDTLKLVDPTIYEFITLGLASSSERVVLDYIEQLRDYLQKGGAHVPKAHVPKAHVPKAHAHVQLPKPIKLVTPKVKASPKKSRKPTKALPKKRGNACPDDKIKNPKTGRCVKKSGKIGKMLNKHSSRGHSSKAHAVPKKPKAFQKKQPSRKICPAGKVLNPKSRRCVKKSGKIGKHL